MIKIEITIPLNYNNGRQIESDKLLFIENYLIAKFNGLSISAPQVGYWLNKRKLYTDNNEICTIITENNKDTIKHIKDLKQLLKTEKLSTNGVQNNPG